MSCFLQNPENESVKVSFDAKKKHIIIPHSRFVQRNNDFKYNETTGMITYLGSKKLFFFNFNIKYVSSKIGGTLTHDLCIDGKSQELDTDHGFTVTILKKGSTVFLDAKSAGSFACTYSKIDLAISEF